MKKLFMTLIASMLLLSSATYAVEMSKSHNPAKQMMTMSKADAQQMFDKAGIDMSKVTVLDNGEMAKTEGEWWNFIIPIFLGWASSIANAPGPGETIHTGNSGEYLQSHIRP